MNASTAPRHWRRLSPCVTRTGLLLAALLAPPSDASAQDRRQVTATDYGRAEQFMSWHAQKLTTGLQVTPRWIDGSRFWYRNRVQDGHEFVLVDVPPGQRRPAFDHDRLASALSMAADTAYEGAQLPFTAFEFTSDGQAIRFHLADSVRWTCDISAYTCPTLDSVPALPRGEVRSPDGERAVFVRDENLWLRQGESGEETQVTTDGEEHYGYGVSPEGCCQEISNRRAGITLAPVARWSPDGRRVATHRYDERDVGELHLIETALGRPKLHSYRYALPGDSIIPTWELHLFDLDTGTSVRVDEEPLPGDFAAADSAWSQVRWAPDGSRLYYTKRPRDFKSVELRVADFDTGETRSILSESGPTLRETNLFIGGPPNWRLLDGGREVLWFSERDGWGHLYRFDGASGELLNRVTEGPWLVMDVLHVDETAGWVYFTAMGREPDRDPYFRHLYRARLTGGGVQLLSPEDADHAVTVSPTGAYFVDQYSRRDMAPVTVVRGPDGGVLQTVEEGDIGPLLETGWQPPVPFRAKGRDGVTDVHGYLYFPSTFDPENDPPGSYPVVDYIYPGPQIGPNGFRGFSLGGWAGEHSLPELGFIVFVVDAMGTPWRSKAFHDAYYGNMGDNGIPDHISALKELALRYPQMDLGRVGIFGHSGGGFSSTGAILRYPDFFKVAVSGAGNHDNRSYLHAWAERYMGLMDPEGGDGHETQSNPELAGNLEGKLLLSYGTLDDNVHPNNTLRLIQELQRHNKDFDLIVLPNRNHGHAADPYAIRRGWDFFVEHLLGAEPPKEYELQGPPGD